MNLARTALGLDGVSAMFSGPDTFSGGTWDGESVSTGATEGADIISPYGETLKGMTIQNGEWARKLGWNGAWSNMRLAALLRINGPTGVDSNSRLFLGLSAGTSQTYGATNCVRAVGILLGKLPTTNENSLERVYDTVGYYKSYLCAVSKINEGYDIKRLQNAVAPAGLGYVVAASGYWSCLHVDFTKLGSYLNVIVRTTDVGFLGRKFVMKNLMTEAYKPGPAGAPADNMADASYAAKDASSGFGRDNENLLDSVNLYWSGNVPLEVGAIIASRTY